MTALAYNQSVDGGENWVGSRREWSTPVIRGIGISTSSFRSRRPMRYRIWYQEQLDAKGSEEDGGLLA